MSPTSTFHNCGSSSSRDLPQKSADRGDPRVCRLRPHRAGLRFCIHAHRTELVHDEMAVAVAHPDLVIQRQGPCDVRRTARATSSMSGAAMSNPRTAATISISALRSFERARPVEPRRENQPARPEVLDGDLPRVLLIHGRQVIEGHSLQLHLEQLVHRQLAAGVGQADDDAVDRVRPHDARNIVDACR